MGYLHWGLILQFVATGIVLMFSQVSGQSDNPNTNQTNNPTSNPHNNPTSNPHNNPTSNPHNKLANGWTIKKSHKPYLLRLRDQLILGILGILVSILSIILLSSLNLEYMLPIKMMGLLTSLVVSIVCILHTRMVLSEITKKEIRNYCVRKCENLIIIISDDL